MFLMAPLPAAIDAGVLARARFFVAQNGPTQALFMAWRQIPFLPVLLGAAACGAYLAVSGNTRPHSLALYAHVALAIASVLLPP